MDSYYDYGYGYDDFGYAFGGSDFMDGLGVLLGIFVIFMLIGWAERLTLYILRSIGLYRLSENRGMSGSGLAWIPFIGFYRIGSIADDIAAKNGGNSYYRYFLLIGGILVHIAGGFVSWTMAMLTGVFSQFFGNRARFPQDFPYSNYSREYSNYFGEFFAYWGVLILISIISLALYVFTVIALYKIYKHYRPMSATWWTVFSVIFPFMQSIFPFVIRNAAPVPEWAAQQGYYPMQPMQNPNWQAPPPPQYQPYNQPPVNNGYPPQNQNWQPPVSPVEPPYQPPVAPDPPEPWELETPAVQPPPQAPWEQNDNSDK